MAGTLGDRGPGSGVTLIEWLDQTPSTQDEAHARAAAGAAHGTAVAARVQTAGRGTRGREWSSGEGGLWMSVVCRPAQGSAVDSVSVRVGLALAELLDGFIRPPARVALKWPNDLMLGNRKLGGILSEARWQADRVAWIVVGVGLNIRNELAVGAARLLDAGSVATAEELAEPAARVIAQAAAAAIPFSSEELAAFRARDWLRGKQLDLPEPGIADGISTAGLLRIKKPDGSVAEVFGSVGLAAAVR